jgi:hypothetical protein
MIKSESRSRIAVATALLKLDEDFVRTAVQELIRRRGKREDEMAEALKV